MGAKVSFRQSLLPQPVVTVIAGPVSLQGKGVATLPHGPEQGLCESLSRHGTAYATLSVPCTVAVCIAATLSAPQLILVLVLGNWHKGH